MRVHAVTSTLLPLVLVVTLASTQEEPSAQVPLEVLQHLRLLVAAHKIQGSLEVIKEFLLFSSDANAMEHTELKRMKCEIEHTNAENKRMKKEISDKIKVVEDLENKLADSQRQVEQLEKQVNLEDTMTPNKENAGRARHCERHPQEQMIKQMVQEFKSSGDNNKLFRDLDDELDHNTEFYWQVRKLTYVLNLAMRMMGKRGYTQLASLLLCAGLPVDTADGDGETMLHGAAREGQLQMVKLLLDHGADTSVKDGRGFTPLIRAAHEGMLDVVKTMVEAGASTTARDIYGHTALERASKSEVIQFLEQFPH